MSNLPYEYMDKEQRDKVRDPYALQRWQAEQLRAERQRSGTLTPEEFERAKKEQWTKYRYARGEEKRLAALAYRKRVDEINRKKQVKRAAQKREEYLVRVANEKIEESRKAGCLVTDLAREIADLETMEGIFQHIDDEMWAVTH